MQRLPQPLKRELAAVIDELLAGNLSSGRSYEKLNAGDNLYSVRLNQAYRFVFFAPPGSRHRSARYRPLVAPVRYFCFATRRRQRTLTGLAPAPARTW